MLRLPQDARPDALDLLRDVVVELPRPARPDVDARSRGSSRSAGVVQPVEQLADFGAVARDAPALRVRRGCRSSATTSTRRPATPTIRSSSGSSAVFQSSGYSWNALVQELLSSPSRRNATPTRRRRPTNGEVVAVSRRDHLCAALTRASGSPDVCGLDATTTKAAADDDPRDRLGAAVGRATAAARSSPILPNAADALLPRGHARTSARRSPRRSSTRRRRHAAGREAVVERAAGRGDRRLRQHRDGARPRRTRGRRRRTTLLRVALHVGDRSRPASRDGRRCSPRSSSRAWRRRPSRSGCEENDD